MGISPEQLGAGLVHSQSVGPPEVAVDEHSTVGAVHSRPLQLGMLPPVRPVHEPGQETITAGYSHSSHTLGVLTIRQTL